MCGVARNGPPFLADGGKTMSKDDDFQGSPASIFWFAFSAFLALMAIAHGAAFLMQHVAPVEDVFHYRVIFAIQASILLLTPALCFHIFSHSDARNNIGVRSGRSLILHSWCACIGPLSVAAAAASTRSLTRSKDASCILAASLSILGRTRSWRLGGDWTSSSLGLLETPSNGCAFSEARSICWRLRCFLEPLCSQTRSKSAYGCLAS